MIAKIKPVVQERKMEENWRRRKKCTSRIHHTQALTLAVERAGNHPPAENEELLGHLIRLARVVGRHLQCQAKVARQKRFDDLAQATLPDALSDAHLLADAQVKNGGCSRGRRGSIAPLARVRIVERQ